MRRKVRHGVSILSLAAIVALAGCGKSDKGNDGGLLRSFGLGSEPPMEFAVVPQKPLELPADLSALPEPQPGARNRTDLTPLEDALVAVGGNPSGGGTVRGDAALLAATGANRAQADIRQVLAREDAVYREEHHGKLLERLLNRDDEAVIYGGMLLDARREALRLRALGLRTPAIPPETPRN